MMKDVLAFIIFGISLMLMSCGQPNPNQQIDEGTVQGDTYTSQEIGWTIQIPEGWTVILKEETDKSNEKGFKAIEEVYEGDIDYSGLKNLIGFQKNQFNIFQSTSEIFKLEYEGEWEDNNAGLKELLYETYTNQRIKIDTSSSKATIDGLDFEVFHITMYGPKGDIILYQDMYSRYINGFDFGVNINYNSNKDKEIMLDAFKNSKFKKR